MSVNEVVMGLGSWSVKLTEPPRELLDALDYFGHVAVLPGRVTPAQYGDTLLTMARYVGVLTKRDLDDDTKTISGQGMAVWLGDADDKGEVLETAVVISGQTFANSIRALLGSGTAVQEGTLNSVAGTYSGSHQWTSRRKAIQYVCDIFGAEWRVNGDATLDAGTQAQLYRATPDCVIVRAGAEGRDLSLTGLPGEMDLTQDVEDFTTRVVLLAEGQGTATATGSADISSNPYLDIRGNPIKRVRLVSESGTATGNAETRAQLQLNRFTGTRSQLRLSAEDYEIRGSFVPGDYVWVYDPDAGLFDTGNEIVFRGQRINPIALRAVETSWPVARGMTVAYRGQDGTWYDLTDYVEFEDGATSITVGDLGRNLTSSGFEPVGSRPIPDSTTPGVVTWVTPFESSVYVDTSGVTRATMLLAWSTPLNADGSTIQDGDHYEIGYGISPATGWETAYAAWGDTQAIINDLSPGVEYDFRIRAVDVNGNAGDWSDTETATAEHDTIPPSAPAAPTVAGSLIAIQIVHTLGKASGGTFNLELDLDHLEIHVGASSTFTADDTTLRGKVAANAGMLQAEIPAVATVAEEATTTRWVRVIAVDIAGNRSDPSDAAEATADLIDDAHITSLAVDKVSAGTVSANWLIGASIRTASSGQRVELDATGLHGFNSGGSELVTLSNTGSFTLRSATSGSRVQLDATGLKVFSGSTEVVSLLATGSFALKSAASGARLEMDGDGLRVFNSGGDQTVAINADTGDVDIQGRFISGPSGKRLIINPLYDVDPEIRIYEDEDEYHYWTSLVSGATPTFQIGSAHNGSGRKTAIEGSGDQWSITLRTDPGNVGSGGRIVGDGSTLSMQVVNGGTWVIDGNTAFGQSALVSSRRFRLELNTTTFEMKYADGSNARQGGYIWCGNSGQRMEFAVSSKGAFIVDNNNLQLHGTIPQNLSGTAAIVCFVLTDFTNNVVSGTVTYGPTYSNKPNPVIQINDDASTEYSWLTDAWNNSGFNYHFSSGTFNAWDMFVWAFVQ